MSCLAQIETVQVLFFLVSNVIIMTKSGKMFIDISKNRQNSINAAKLRSMYTFCCVFFKLKKWQGGSGEHQKGYDKKKS